MLLARDGGKRSSFILPDYKTLLGKTYRLREEKSQLPKNILSTKMSGELQQHHSLELHSYHCAEART